VLEPVTAGFSDPARLRAALGYYRAIPRALFSTEAWSLLLRPLPVSGLVLHGARDGCVGPEMFEGQAHLFSAGLETVCIGNAGHFLQAEQPARFAEVVLRFLRRI
jgi:pimeloyl-ACP methyl ester carboxylesterase